MSRAKAVVITLLAAVLVLEAASVRAVDLSAEAIAAAKTAAEHNSIADAYAKEAAELKKKAVDHRAMLASYDNGPGYLKEKSGLKQHCESLISYYEKGASDAEVMAKMHRDMAAQAK